MKTLVLKNCKNMQEALQLIKNAIDEEIKNGAIALITNVQLGAAIQDISEFYSGICAPSGKIVAQEGPYKFLEYNGVEFFVDPHMQWSDLRILFFSEKDKNNEFDFTSYSETKVEFSGFSLI